MADTGLDLFSILVATLQDVSFWTGLLTIAAFSQGRFSEKQLDHEELDPPLPARSFTSRFRYHSAASLYMGAFVALYCALVVVGSMPGLQGVLKDLFGSFKAVDGAALTDDGGSGALEIGTPAWAAMVLMVLAPTIPWLRRTELSFRLWLQDFSNIPFKARELGEDILAALAKFHGEPEGIDRASPRELTHVFEGLRKVREHLSQAGRSRRSEKYRSTFLEHDELLKRTERRFSFVVGELRQIPARARGAAEDGPPDAPTAQELRVLTRRYSRLLACILLQIEAEEFYARRLLRRIPELEAVPLSDYRFGRGQILIGILVIVSLAVLLGPLASLVVNRFLLGAVLSPEQVWNMIAYWFQWGLAASVAFILPVTFAAAIHLYLIDRKYFREDEGGWGQTAATLLLAFFGCYGLALLPIVAVQAWRASAEGAFLGLFEAMLMSLPPAVVSVLYIWLSSRSFGASRGRTLLMDFTAFALTAGCVAGGVAAVLTVRTLSSIGAEDFRDFPTLIVLHLGPVVTATIVAGVFGALQCAMSQEVAASAHERWEERTQDSVAADADEPARPARLPEHLPQG